MNENVNVKKGKGNIIVIILLIIIVLGLTSYIVYDKVIVGNQKEEIKEETKKEEVKDNNKNIKLEDSNKEIVYDLVNKTFDTEYGTKVYNLPYINIKSDYAKEINNDINEIKTKNDSNAEEYVNNKLGYLEDVYYKYYENDNVISIVIVQKTPDEYTGYNVYNIDKYTGEYISSKDLIESKKIDKEDITKRLDEFINQNVNSESLPEIAITGMYKINELVYGLPMYLNENNELCIFSYFHQGAGGMNYYPYTFNYDKNTRIYIEK